MKNTKLILFAVAVALPSISLADQPNSSQTSRQVMSVGGERIEVHPTAWTQLELKGVDKNLGSKIAAQITANPKNATALVAALIAANPDHAEAITAAAIVTLDSHFAAAITNAAVAALPTSAVAITKAAINVAPKSVAEITAAAVKAAPSQIERITTAAVTVAPQLAGQIVREVVGLAVIVPPVVAPHSESSVNNTSVRQTVIISALDTTLKSCSTDQCRNDAVDTALKQLTTSPVSQPEAVNEIENKRSASPS